MACTICEQRELFTSFPLADVQKSVSKAKAPALADTIQAAHDLLLGVPCQHALTAGRLPLLRDVKEPKVLAGMRSDLNDLCRDLKFNGILQ